METIIGIIIIVVVIYALIRIIKVYKELVKIDNQRHAFFELNRLLAKALSKALSAKSQEEADSAWIDVEILQMEIDRTEIKPPFET